VKNISIICFAIFISCNQPKQDNPEIFIVPLDTMPVYKSKNNQPPPPPPIREYYRSFNLIVDTGAHIYFYQLPKKTGWICGTGMDWKTPPMFIDLRPKDLVQIPGETIEQFIQLNVLNVQNEDRLVSIASVIDTIKSKGFTKIMGAVKDPANHIKWIFRRVTQEESVVLDYKTRQVKYDSDDIKWDSTKILLSP
jgi:hypothetical protein